MVVHSFLEISEPAYRRIDSEQPLIFFFSPERCQYVFAVRHSHYHLYGAFFGVDGPEDSRWTEEQKAAVSPARKMTVSGLGGRVNPRT